MVLQMLMFYITKNKSLSDDFILEQFEQHSERIRRLEELCTGGLTDDDLSRELRWQKADQEDSRATKTHKVKFDFQCTELHWVYLIFQNPNRGEKNYSKILILGGTDDNATLAEILDLKNQSINSCLIMGASYSTGAFLVGTTPVICGGYPETTHCNIVKNKRPAKKFLAELSQERTYAASGVMNDGALWITGGYPGPTDTSELVKIGKNQSSM